LGSGLPKPLPSLRSEQQTKERQRLPAAGTLQSPCTPRGLRLHFVPPVPAGRRGAPSSVTAPGGAIARCAGSNAPATSCDDPFGEDPSNTPVASLRLELRLWQVNVCLPVSSLVSPCLFGRG
jgi:hypothetical protein